MSTSNSIATKMKKPVTNFPERKTCWRVCCIAMAPWSIRLGRSDARINEAVQDLNDEVRE